MGKEKRERRSGDLGSSVVVETEERTIRRERRERGTDSVPLLGSSFSTTPTLGVSRRMDSFWKRERPSGEREGDTVPLPSRMVAD